MSKQFLCGAARADITPAVGTCLFGYVPDWHSESVHDGLNATAAAFSDGEKTVLLITVTVCEFQNALADELRALAANAASVPVDNIILSATHTHSAPNCAGQEGWGDVDRAYTESVLKPAVTRIAGEAVRAMRPAVLGAATTESHVGINRREMDRDGHVILGQDPNGTYDPTMTVISIRGDDGKGILNLIHYGCHGTSAGRNREITRDWSGIMCDRLETETETLTAYWQGAEGDVGPRLTNGRTTGDIRHTEELGGLATFDAMRAYKAIRRYDKVGVGLFVGDIALPYRELPTVETCTEKMASFPDPESLVNLDALIYAYYRNVKAALLSGDTGEDALKLRTNIITLGNIAFVPFPFEMFSTITLRLSALSPFAHTLSLSCSNGSYAYLPSMDQLIRGGYEVRCFLYQSVRTLADDTEQTLIDGCLGLMNGERL